MTGHIYWPPAGNPGGRGRAELLAAAGHNPLAVDTEPSNGDPRPNARVERSSLRAEQATDGLSLAQETCENGSAPAGCGDGMGSLETPVTPHLKRR
jgi:hypothetical protein